MYIETEKLAAMFEYIAERLRVGDSFEGNINYTCMSDGLEHGEFEVTGAFRVGNADGQGGMVVL